MIILLIIGILLTGLAIGSLARVTIWPRGGHKFRRRAQTRRGVRAHERTTAKKARAA
jgi:hypothetical protein